jgi:hypothetical protein
MPDASEHRLPREALEQIIRRATELQMGASVGDATGGDERLSDAEFLRIGAEVGLEETHLRRALGEMRAQALSPALPNESGLSASLFGSGHVRASRVIRGEASALSRALHLWLQKSESLVAIRDRGTESLWEPSSALEDVMRRAFSGGKRRYTLASLRSFGVSMVPLEEGWTLVSFTADLTNRRNEEGWGYLVGFSALGVLPGVAMGIPVGVWSSPAFGIAAIMAGIAAGSIGGAALGKRQSEGTRARIQLEMEGLLDRMERGDLTPQSLRQRLGLRA